MPGPHRSLPPPGWLRAGRVGAPHGLDGSFHVAEPVPDLLRQGLTVRIAGAERCIERRAGYDARPIVRLEGCTNRDAARALRGADLLISREHAPELGQDEWWAEDLEGCMVHDGGRPIGRVRRLLALPACEVLEVERNGAADLLVPLISDAVREVDPEAGAIDIDLQFLGETP